MVKRFLNLPYAVQGPLAKLLKADDHISHLDAGIVNVVLYFHHSSHGSQEPDQCIAQHGIAQMPDVGRFVGVDISVFDDALFTRRRGIGTTQPLAEIA